MSREQQNFQSLVDKILQGTDMAPLRPVVEKEVLHYDILNAMQKHGALRDLVFQGGTSLRLVYGSNRFSEDLDFAGGPGFNKDNVEGVAEAISDHLKIRYGLSVNVKLPKEKPIQDGVNVSAWQVSIETAPARPDLPKQRIKLEIANVTAQTRKPMNLQVNYRGLPPSFQGLILPVEEMREIMADKIVSLPAVTSHIRNRDVWDIGWLNQQMVGKFKPDVDMISQKVEEYGIEHFEDKLNARIDSIPEIVDGPEFRLEMQRFLVPSVFQNTMLHDEFREILTRNVSDVLIEARDAIYRPDSSAGATFRM